MEHKDQDGYFNAFRGLMDRSLNDGIFSTISVRAHNNEYFFSKIPLMKTLDYAASKGVPVWTEVQLLQFLKVKDEATFTDHMWSDNKLSFEINSSLKHDNRLICLIFDLVRVQIKGAGEEDNVFSSTIVYQNNEGLNPAAISNDDRYIALISPLQNP